MFPRIKKTRPRKSPRKVLTRSLERLERRELLTTTMAVLDFNGASETDLENASARLSNNFDEVDQLSSFMDAFSGSSNPSLDFDGDGRVDVQDGQIAIERVVDRVRQDFSPYNIDVVLNDQTTKSAGAISQLRNNSSTNDVLVYVTGSSSVASNATDEAGDSAAIVDGSIGWSNVIGSLAGDNAERAERFANLVANNISRVIGTSLGLPAVNDSGTLMDSSSVSDSRNLSFGLDSDVLLSGKLLGRSENAWVSVSRPGELTIHGSNEADEVRIEVSAHRTDNWLISGIGERQISVDASATPGFESLNQYPTPIETIVFHGHDGNDVFDVDESIVSVVHAYGGAGDDQLSGGAGNDRLYGDDGSDILDGRAGHDTLLGGIGVDRHIAGDSCDTDSSLANVVGSDVVTGVTLKSFTVGAGGWRVAKNPRMMADVNGDGLDDIVGFANRGVYVSLSNGHDFEGATKWHSGFSYNSGGWRVEKHPRMMADVNGDGMADIVGFGSSGVTVAYSDGQSFSNSETLKAFGSSGGWSTDKHLRTTADVNGDGMSDIVGFGDSGVFVSLSTGDGLSPSELWLSEFGYGAGGWRILEHERVMADVNGDGMDDIVGFGGAYTYVALATGSGFEESEIWEPDFAYNQGWRPERHLRKVVDVNNDGAADVVGFGHAGVLVSLSTRDGFSQPQAWSQDFGYADGWRVNSDPTAYWEDDKHPRELADVNNDGFLDIVAFGESGVQIALSTGEAFEAPVAATIGRYGGWDEASYPRTVAEVNGDGRADIVGFAWAGVSVTTVACGMSAVGDLDDDGSIDASDIDLISAAIREGSNDLDLDLNADGEVSSDDRAYLIDKIFQTSPGDANLDGVFDTSDLVQVFQRGQYEDGIEGNSGWADGDWDGDGEFSSGDLIAAFSAGRYEQG